MRSTRLAVAALLAAAGLHADDVVVSFYRDVMTADMHRILAHAGLTHREHPDMLPWEALASGTEQQIEAAAASPDVARVFPASAALVSGKKIHACADALLDAGPIADLVLTIGQGWDGPGQGSAELTYTYRHNTEQLPADEVRALIERAMSEWKRYADIRIDASDTPGVPRSLDISFERSDHGDQYGFDGRGGNLAHTFYPTSAEPWAGDIHIDDDDTWTSDELYSVLLHEIGHALGVGHSTQPGAVMYPYYSSDFVELQQEDVKALQRLYAAPPEDRQESLQNPTE